MKVSEFILEFLAAQGVEHVFLVTGGVITPIVDAFRSRKDIRYICCQHEQAAAMAADGYARFKGLGVAMGTSGPGATNLITGIGCSWFDSIPTLFITGQVNTGELKKLSGVRQRGFQETDIVSIVKPITKYARMVTDPLEIQYELEAAIWNAQSGRRGPALLDVPMDVQRAEVDPRNLRHFVADPEPVYAVGSQIPKVLELLAKAERPVVIYGAGAREARAELLDFLDRSGIPCLPSWAALDLIPHDHRLFVSQFGVYGCRAGNLAVQNADLVLAIGTRLDTRMTGGKPETFAPKAKKIVVDIDIHEATKAVKADVLVISDAWYFLRQLNQSLPVDNRRNFAYLGWLKRIEKWKQKYPILQKYDDRLPIQPLDFVATLSDAVPFDAVVVADAGANLSWVQQAFKVKAQRVFSAYGFSPMGYSFPAAIGAWFATQKPVICVIGDGGMQINIQELQTLAHYRIPLKVFILNNSSYGIIKQFQEELFNGRYHATDPNSGYSFPDFQRVANAYGLSNMKILNASSARWMPKMVIEKGEACIVDVMIDPDARIFPKVQFGNPLENQSPLLDPAELAENMRDE